MLNKCNKIKEKKVRWAKWRNFLDRGECKATEKVKVANMKKKKKISSLAIKSIFTYQIANILLPSPILFSKKWSARHFHILLLSVFDLIQPFRKDVLQYILCTFIKFKFVVTAVKILTIYTKKKNVTQAKCYAKIFMALSL